MNNSDKQSGLRPVTMGLYPTMETLQSVIDLGMSQLPVMTPNALTALFYTYHNTLLKVINDQTKET